MGKIHKTAGKKHEATLSPALTDIILKAKTLKLRHLSQHLSTLPPLWPFPRGDLYHWIPVLDRFDEILAKFITLYGLQQIQTRPFGSELLRADDQDREATEVSPREAEPGQDGEEDRKLVEGILNFTIVLLQNCGNRSLYSSSDRLNDLLNTTSLSLLKTTLQVSLLLARRYFSSRQRMNSVSHHSLLLSHYNITVDKVRRLAAPFAIPHAGKQRNSNAAHVKEKVNRKSGAPETQILPADIVSMVKATDIDDSIWRQWGEITFSYWNTSHTAERDQPVPDTPTTPSVRRPSNLAPHSAPQPLSTDSPTAKAPESQSEKNSLQKGENQSVPYETVVEKSSEGIICGVINEYDIPQDSHYDLLQKTRISKAFTSGKSARLDMISIRLLAIANLAYVEPDAKFVEKIAQADSEEPRRLQLAYQLAELVHPPDEGAPLVPMEMQTLALSTLEAMTKQKSRTMDIYTALSATVNHGILFYVVRKGVAQLSQDEDNIDMVEENWREALFSLLSSLPTAIPRAGDQMMAAGLMDILVEILGLRTNKASRNQWKVLTFLDNFIYSVRDGYQSLANAKGLDAIKELTGWTISNSITLVKTGQGMPEEYKTQITDYQVPFFQQLTLRWLCKFINHLMTHNGGNFGRQLRNLIDSPEILDGLKQIISGADLFGANVWSGAVNIFSTFIHNEPTSYSVIAESRLGETFLEAITRTSIAPSDTAKGKAAAGANPTPETSGILPLHEAITVIPHAFGALCLNEAGMKLVQDSNALECFFRIFESPIHVRAMEGKESDMDLACEMGRAFEELVRHQPTLGSEILAAVQGMVERVGKLCRDKAINDGYGAKLWVTGPGGKLFVAGGRAALAGRGEQAQTSTTEDVAMGSEISVSKEIVDAHNAEISVDELEEQISQRGPHPTSYLSVATRFLGTFLANSTMCAAFINKGGLENALDLATLPCLPYSFEATNCMSLYDDLSALVKLLIDQKPFIALPATIKRVEATLEDLQPLLEHNSQSAFFSPFTSSSSDATNNSSAILSAGTSYAKALVVVNVLCGALAVSFGQQTFSPRAPPALFSQVNLTDVYVRLIQGLGKLHRSCLWEETLLIENMPPTWNVKTRVSGHGFAGHGFGGSEADNVLGIVPASGINTPSNLTTSGATRTSDSAIPWTAEQSDDSPETNTMQFHNTRIIRNLLCQAPISISSFFQLLGKQLLPRRADAYLRQNSFKVADQLVAWMLEELQFDLPRSAPARYRYSYWIVILTSMTQLMIDDGLERGTPQLLTVIVASFKKQNGFAAIDSILEAFFEESKALIASSEEAPQADSSALLNLAMGGIKIILEFYSRVINSRYLIETAQTAAMSSGSRTADRDRSEPFVPSQFLVELRKAVLQPARKMWGESESAFMDKATTSIVKSLIEILRLELDGEQEAGAFKRKDKIPKKRSYEPIKWKVKNQESLKKLSEEYGQDLALEALFRCNEQPMNAREYCWDQKDHARSSRTPIPPSELSGSSSLSESPHQPSSSRDRIMSDASPSENPNGSTDSSDNSLVEFTAEGIPRTLELTQEQVRDMAQTLSTTLSAAQAEPAAPVSAPPMTVATPASDDRVLAGDVEGLVTVELLDEDRTELRTTLIDRCLDILNVHDDVTFELSDLIAAAVQPKAVSNGSLRLEIASTLLSSLTSLQMSDDMEGEEARMQSKKIASYAHLLALVLQDKEFYLAIQDDLNDNFGLLVEFIKLEPNQKMQDASSFLGQVLLILERLLTDDAMPSAIEYNLPGLDDVVDESKPLAQMKPGFISADEKLLLFDAIINVLPHIGKDESLALSVSRVLVILTRSRPLAVRLGEKPNIRRLFSMVKQLHGATNERLQSAFLLALRHIIEDDETVRNIMRAEIVAVFENPRQPRNLDINTYARTLAHLAIRNPEIFVKVTNEKCMIKDYDSKHTPQIIVLKKAPSHGGELDPGTEGNPSEAEKPAGETVAESKEVIDAERPKNELKMPIVENPDGVIHFILGELLAYKEVEDAEISPPALGKGKQAISVLTDVDMTNGQASSSTSTPEPPSNTTTNGDQAKKDRSKDQAFKPEEHSIYIYRCFMLQCLTELLSCYNRTKIEFINFKRKADPQGTTPSKPRSFVLNYLLNTLIPEGTLEHPINVAGRKKHNTSSWAMSVVVSLCSKTGEGGYNRPHLDMKDYKEEPELLFVRKFVLEHAIRAFREAQSNSSEALEHKYARLLNLADLFNRMLTGKPNAGSSSNSNVTLEMLQESQRMLAKIMYEKNFISSLTSSIADIDLNFPGAKRAVKYILRPLQYLTRSANSLSLLSDQPIAPGSVDEDDISSDSSVSDMDDTREETPDLFRNSALGILDPGREEDTDSESDDNDEDEEMYEDEYGDEMDYDEEMSVQDHVNALNDVISDEEQDDEMGPIEGLPGDIGMEIEVDMGGDEGDDLSGSDDDEDSDDMEEDEEDMDEDGIPDLEDMEEGEGGSIGADDEGWGTDEGEDEEDYPGQDDIEDDQDGLMVMDDGMNLDHLPQAILNTLADPELLDNLEMREGDEEEDEEEEDYEEEDFAFEPEMDGVSQLMELEIASRRRLMRAADDEEIDMRGMPWGWEGDPRAHHHHHHHHHAPGRQGNHWGMFNEARDARMFPTYRSHRPAPGGQRTDDGTNPLLQRNGRNGPSPAGGRRRNGDELSDWVTAIDPMRPGSFISPNDGPVSFISNLINMMTQQPGGGALGHRHPGQTLHLHIGGGVPFPGGALPRELESMLRMTRDRRHDGIPRGTARDEQESVAFIPTLTVTRWQEEVRLLYGQNPNEKSARVVNSILQLLVPPAIKYAKQKAKEKAERKEKERIDQEAAKKAKEEADAKAKEESEAKEKKEAEERAAAGAHAAATRNEPEGDTSAVPAEEVVAMEGVEHTETAEAPDAAAAEPAEPAPRVTINIRGRQVDITHLGIDIEYLEALPEEFREEVLMQQIQQQRSEAAASGEPSEISPEFLEALPDDIRNELLQQEALERRRREREEARRQANANGGAPPPQPEEIDPASFFATLDPSLRASLLIEADDTVLQGLPPDMQAEARALAGHRRLEHYVDMDMGRGGRPRGLERAGEGGESEEKRKPTQYVQILDKAGVATLLRLMFIPQQGSAKQSLNGILRDVCQNKQNRAEVVSILLSILQDGSNDVNAVERSFAHLTLRAKQPATQKTLQPKRATPELTSTGDMSPLMVVQQCLNTLEFLTTYNPRIAEFFLTEHETGTGFKSRSQRKGKGKETKASRYPLNALLGLLDRKLVIESSPVMEQLASLLQRITHPLVILLKKDKKDEKAIEEAKAEESGQPSIEATTEMATTTNTEAPAAEQPPSADVEMTTPVASDVTPIALESGPTAVVVVPIAEGEPEQKSEVKPVGPSDEKKKHRTLSPPEVPEYNLRLIINIIAARECPAKTFKDTLSLITNLSTIPEAKEIFGKELISQAQGLGNNILRDLEELSAQISKATTGTDVQGMALARFSPASSDQAKLLRVITALDFLFDPKRSDTVDKPSSSIEGLEAQQKEDILTTLYENNTFESLWNKLSECLAAIRKRGNMFNVANILLPLIEVLMVVCKNTTLKDAPVKPTKPTEFALASPEPEGREARMENLFFIFTEEHRKVLNDLVRHNPKLMSGSFSLLVKNSKVLEFDNKRNFFNRKLHARTEVRQPHPSLQLQVRRSQVFLDSFKSLYYKKPDEFKYGKLSIRFSGEEGVDAGGVTREWFQVLTKQMFDPNYALFNPVASDRTTFHPNPLSGINEQHLTFYKFIGRVIGKALYEGRVLDCHFSRAVYKRILGRAISVKDMESLDLEYYKSLLWILQNDITDIITETFSVETEAFGEVQTVDLKKPDGRNIPVNQDNKEEYVRLVVEHRMIGSVKEQLDHFLQGFHDIVPAELIAIFNEQELELLISGLPDIDVDDWKNNTEYHNYQASSPQIQWFWRAVRSFDKEERAKLLQFVTGTSKVPLNGFKELEGMNGFSRFNIHRDYGNKDRLPSSHTCFNQLDLPEYETYEDLRKSILTAVTAGGEYFGFA
ncbi:hypothetical protein EJ08DRAFT_315920 [Tothia fuscella]|uniref:HECT-type E3 ubiquitin transferase n=1 Tax=Tothia fuscella TaxID=1048955 RepID=A0A9P4NNC9_9PEZI|nr:hypothetical protein EJ08DRAFT_315920 [Tothia fuscella]